MVHFDFDYNKWTQGNLGRQGSGICRKVEKLCKAEVIQIYSKMTKAVFAESTIRSLKNIVQRYMEDDGKKYIHNLSQFVKTLNFNKMAR